MLEKFTQVYAKLIAESVENKKKMSLKNLKKNCKGVSSKKSCKGKKVIKEQAENTATQLLTLTFASNEDGDDIRCYCGTIEGVGTTYEEALQDFAAKFDSKACADCFECDEQDDECDEQDEQDECDEEDEQDDDIDEDDEEEDELSKK